MSSSTISHHAAPAAAAAAAVVAIALGGVALSIAHDSGAALIPTEPGQSVVAPPAQHGGHDGYTPSERKFVGGP